MDAARESGNWAFGGMGVKWWRVVLVVLGATALSILLAHRADAATGTDVCGSLPTGQTTWNGLGSPYRICDSGVTVPANANLVLDGAAGTVQVQAQGLGGVLVDGAISTQATSPLAEIMFDGSGWDGITSSRLWTGQPATVTFDLSYVDVAHSGGIGGQAASFKLDHVAVHDGPVGIAPLAAATSITNSSVSHVSSDGINTGCASDIGTTAPSTVIESNAIVDAGRRGIAASACGQPESRPFVVRHNRVSESGHGDEWIGAPNLAVTLDSFNGSTLGPGQDIDDNQGNDNLRDVLQLSGTIDGGFTWVTPTNASSMHPLGYALRFSYVQGPGTVTIPAGSVVKGVLRVGDGGVDASAPGSIFTSPLDNSVGVPLCPVTSSTSCQPGRDDTEGGAGVDSASGTFVDATARFGERGFVSSGSLFVSGSTISDVGIGLSAGSAGVMGTTDLHVDGTHITRTTGTAIGGANLTHAIVSNVQISDAGQGIGVWVGDGGQLSVTGVSVDAAGRTGIDTEGLPGATLVVQGNHVTNSGHSPQPNQPFRPAPAMIVRGDVALGSGALVTGNTGSGNGLDAIELSGTVSTSFTWVSPTNSSSDHAFGYMGDSLTLPPGVVMTVPQGSVLKFHSIAAGDIAPSLAVSGGTVDASAGGSIWTAWDDPSAGPVACFDAPNFACPTTFSWMGIKINADSATGTKGNAHFIGAAIRDGDLEYSSGAASTIGDPTHGLAVDGSTFDGGRVMVRSTGARIDGSRITRHPGDILDYAAAISDGVGATMSCDTITKNSGGIVIFSSGETSSTALTITKSNIFGNRQPPPSPPYAPADLDASELSSPSVPVAARSNWWGQPGGPVPGQINNAAFVDASSPLDQPSSCAPSTGAPDPPTAVSAVGGNGSAAVDWTAPASPGAGPITGYTVTSSPGGKTTTVDGSTTHATVTGLADGTNYTFTVHATNEFGDSVESAPSNVATPAAPPPPLPHSRGGFILDDWGGIHPFSTGSLAPPAITAPGPYWPGQDVVRGIASMPVGGYVVDDWGGIHPYATGGSVGPIHGGPYWPGQDVVRGIALLPSGAGGYVLDDWGGLHPFGVGSHAAPPAPQGGPYWAGVDAARGVTILPDGSGGYVVDAWGGLHPFLIPGSGHTMPLKPANGPYWPGQDVVRGVAANAEGNAGYVLDDWGGVHPFGLPGTTGTIPSPSGGPYWPGRDVTRGISVVP
jgi:hypothetical protein